MPAGWCPLTCKPKKSSEVHDPVTKSRGSRCISNLKDETPGSKSHIEKDPVCSPRSIGSNEFINPVTHEIVVSNSTCELKITRSDHDNGGAASMGTSIPRTIASPRGVSALMGALSPTTMVSPTKTTTPGGSSNNGDAGNTPSNSKSSVDGEIHGCSHLICHRCGEQFENMEAVEAHHLSYHAVTELDEGNSSKMIVEKILGTVGLMSEENCLQVESILKVHNMQKTLVGFEEYREMVKDKASNLKKKHPRCLADGNELLRFHGTTLECSLGMNGSSGLCDSSECRVCQILRNGFPSNESLNSDIGVFTTSTSVKAFESIELCEENLALKKVVIVCRVIAGRIHKTLENHQEVIGQSEFDSLSGKMDQSSNVLELYLLNPKALLPCFVVICKP